MNRFKAWLIRRMNVTPEDLAEIYEIEDNTPNIEKTLETIASLADNSLVRRFAKPEQKELLITISQLLNENKEVVRDGLKLGQDLTKVLGMRV